MNTFNVIFVGDGLDRGIIENVFENVDIVTTQKEAMMLIMTRKDKSVPVLFIVDIDHHFKLLERMCQSIQYDPTINLIPVACSHNDSTSFMLECIQMGAVDYMLKPIREPLLKTMFLNVYRHQSRKRNSNSQLSTTDHHHSTLSQFQDRLDSISRNNHWLTETIIDQYTPKPITQRRLSMHSLTDERKEFLNRYICDWNFSPLELEQVDLIQCVFSMLDQTFEQLPELNSLRMKEDIMYDFIFDVSNSYHNSNPYHNFRHAVDVMQSTWYFLCSMHALTSPYWSRHDDGPSFKSTLRPIQLLALLMASLGHDVGHPGVNNGFMITTATPLAVLYNDKSVLESYHAMAFFNLLCKYFVHANIDIKVHPEYKEFRKTLIHSILCTDMGCHGDYLKEIRDAGADVVVAKDNNLVICTAIMKCADISNCTRPFPNAKAWAILLAEEFSIQGDLEKELLIPSIPINERGKVSLPDFQLYFMNAIALDLYSAVGTLIPNLSFCCDIIRSNVEIWERKKKEEQQ